MLYVIHGIDGEKSLEKRQENYPAHKAHIANASQSGITIVMSGPLTKEDHETSIGSLIICDAASHAAVEAFHHSDPFYRAGVWEKTTIHAFKKTVG